MAKGLDTTVLICCELREHPGHGAAKDLLHRLVGEGTLVGLAPQVLSEFIHVATDPKRFSHPLAMEDAVARARHWWEAKEVTQVFPSADSGRMFLDLMLEHRLGRKRILDTQLAATYLSAGISTIVTTNPRDFRLFKGISVLQPEE